MQKFNDMVLQAGWVSMCSLYEPSDIVAIQAFGESSGRPKQVW